MRGKFRYSGGPEDYFVAVNMDYTDIHCKHLIGKFEVFRINYKKINILKIPLIKILISLIILKLDWKRG